MILSPNKWLVDLNYSSTFESFGDGGGGGSIGGIMAFACDAITSMSLFLSLSFSLFLRIVIHTKTLSTGMWHFSIVRKVKHEIISKIIEIAFAPSLKVRFRISGDSFWNDAHVHHFKTYECSLEMFNWNLFIKLNRKSAIRFI